MAKPATREERINYELNFNVELYGSGDIRSSRLYCEAYVDGMIAIERIQEKYKNNGIEYLRGYREAVSNGAKMPMDIQIMGYSLDEICKIIIQHEERKSKAIIVDYTDKSPVIIKRNGNVILDETK